MLMIASGLRLLSPRTRMVRPAIELTADQFHKIETAGRVFLSPKARKALKHALVVYCAEKDIQNDSPRRFAVHKPLEDAKQSINQLISFLTNQANDAGNRDALDMIVAALPGDSFTTDTETLDREPTLAECLRDYRPPETDVDGLVNHLTVFQAAIHEAINSFPQAPADDTGGDNPNTAYNTLLATVRDIYHNKATGRKRGFDRFASAVFAVIPEDIRPAQSGNLLRSASRVGSKKQTKPLHRKQNMK